MKGIIGSSWKHEAIFSIPDVLWRYKMVIEGIIKLILAGGVYKISTGRDMRFSLNRQTRDIGRIIAIVLGLWALWDFLKAAGLL